MKLPRRSLLASGPAGIAAWVMARLGFGADPEVRDLLRLLGDQRAVQAISAACLSVVGSASARALARDVPADGKHLRSRIGDDFAAGRIVVADGWVLSSTEARLYALAALSHQA